MQKKKLAIVLCSTSNQMFAVGNVLIGLKKHFSMPENEYDIILYIGGKINIKDEKAVKSISNNITIKNYKSPLSKEFRNSNAGLCWSQMAPARFECFSLLNEYKKVLYMDNDILIQKDIIDIVNMSEQLCATFEKKPIIDNVKMHSEKFDSNKYNLETDLFLSGVFLLNDNINENYNKIVQWCYKMTEKWLIADQPLLNLAVQEFNIKTLAFDEKYQMIFYPNDTNMKNGYILHPCWSPKFWNGHNYEEWNKNNNEWIELGGLPYDDEYVSNKMKEINKIAW